MSSALEQFVLEDQSQSIVDVNAASIQASRKMSRGFQWTVAVSIIALSFFYGLSTGFSRRIAPAQAAIPRSMPVRPESFNMIKAPKGVQLRNAGDEVRINGRPAEIANFVSERSVKEILQDQVKIWEAFGYKAYGATSEKRGVALAMNPKTGERQTIMAFAVPDIFRLKISEGLPVQGTISAIRNANSAEVSEAEGKGEVPGVPVAPGGMGGAIFSSVDPGGRSYSTAYTIPGPVSDAIEYYRGIMPGLEWRPTEVRGMESGVAGNYGSLMFERGREQLTLLFSETRVSTEGAKTLVTVALTGSN